MVPPLNNFQFTGPNLVNEINSLNPSTVLDVGCGANFFKGKIRNLVGFDRNPRSNNADFISSILDAPIEPESIDIALLLGSIQSNTRDHVVKNLERIVTWIRPGGLMIVRNLPFIDLDWHNESKLTFVSPSYRWTFADLVEFTQRFNLTIVQNPKLDINLDNPVQERITWRWTKN